MLKTIVEILEDNDELLTPAEQKALRLRLAKRGNSQLALDEEMDRLHGAYNQTNAFVISLLVRVEQLENILKEKKIPMPEGPDYTLTRARIATENRRTLYPELLHALRLAGEQLEAAVEREPFYKDIILVLKDLVATQKDSLAEMGTSLTRARNDKDELKALNEPPAPAAPEPSLCRDDNEASLPPGNLKEARKVLGERCRDEDLVEKVVYLCHHAVDAETLVRQHLNPLRQNPQTGLSGLSKRAWAKVVGLCREEKKGFGSSTMQSLL